MNVLTFRQWPETRSREAQLEGSEMSNEALLLAVVVCVFGVAAMAPIGATLLVIERRGSVIFQGVRRFITRHVRIPFIERMVGLTEQLRNALDEADPRVRIPVPKGRRLRER
jgi:hypothetical protein